MSEQKSGGATPGGATRWFLRKFFSTPATWIGAVVALLCGNASLGVDIPLGGAIGGGLLMGFMAGVAVFGIEKLIRASHKIAIESGEEDSFHSQVSQLAENLHKEGESKAADILEKLYSDREDIQNRCRSETESVDAVHTLELVTSIARESYRQAEELEDLVRRAADPILETPEGAEGQIEKIRTNLESAYRAVANARSRLRKGQTLEKSDFLADPGSFPTSDLSSLTSQLEEETAISCRVEDRIRPNYKSGIVFDEDGGEEDLPQEELE